LYFFNTKRILAVARRGLYLSVRRDDGGVTRILLADGAAKIKGSKRHRDEIMA